MNLELSKKWFPYARRKEKAEKTLVCFSHSGGSANAYQKWNEVMPQRIEILALQLPGRENRLSEPPVSSLSLLMRQMGQEVGPFFRKLDRPFAFFGHSLGGLVAFEFARELRRQNQNLPESLIVSCTHAPQFQEDEPPIHGYPDDLFLKEVMDYKGTPPEFLKHPELVDLFLPILRADFALRETYVYKEEASFEFPIRVYGAYSDTELKLPGLEAWSVHALGDFKIRMFEGNHFYLHARNELFFRALVADCLAQS
jgi:medium-chain acyl-[acyl-carrier-protein] hydrolase